MTPLNLAHINRILRPTPFHILQLLDTLVYGRSIQAVRTLATRYLPAEHAQTVLGAQNGQDTFTQFATLFSEHVFPLNLEHLGIDPSTEEFFDEIDQAELLRVIENTIPYQIFGIDYSDELHELHEHAPGGLIATAFIANIFHTDGSYFAEDSTAFRNIWAEHLTDHWGVSPEAISRVPTFGHPPELVIQAVADTEHSMAADVVTYLAQLHENVFLTWYSYEEPFYYSDPWTDENIQAGTEAWEYARGVLDRMHQYLDLQNDRVPAMFDEVLTLTEAQAGENIP